MALIKPIKYILFFMGVSSTIGLYAQKTKFSIGVLGVNSIASHNFHSIAGSFDVKQAGLKPGFDLGITSFPFYQYPHLFISTGLRGYLVETNVAPQPSANMQVDNLDFYWRYHWASLSIPFHMGTRLFPLGDGGMSLDVYAGASFGIMPNIDQSAGTEYIVTGSGTWHVEGGKKETSIISSNDFLTTLDIGVRAAPLKTLPNLTIGFLLSHNATPTQTIFHNSQVFNQNRTSVSRYTFEMSARYTNLVFSINYSFGKNAHDRNQKGLSPKKPRGRNYQYNCTGG